MTTTTVDPIARRNVWALVFAQAILGSQLAMIFVICGLAGQKLAPNICFATMPISLIVFGSMTTAPWLSNFMQRFGRVPGLFLGALGGAIGAAICAYAMVIESFGLLLLGSYLTGIYMSSQGFFRFAAMDMASDEYKPRAVSYVMAGGLASAIIGPQLGKVSFDWSIFPFTGTYIAAIGLNVVGCLSLLFLKIPVQPQKTTQLVGGRSRVDLLRDPVILVSIICAMVAYALMNLVMTSTPLAVVGCGFTQNQAGDIVMAHVLAMFAPSFVTGHLINRFGVRSVVGSGLGILALAGIVAVAGVDLLNFYGALILLGIGWNFAFIGATSMLATAHSVEERGRVQGMNDFFVFGLVTVASLASGGLMNCSGGDPVAGWTSVNVAMVPFLLIAGIALAWLAGRSRSPQPAQ
ncbi:MAG: MFS transporter [Pseudomonadota bacterium]